MDTSFAYNQPSSLMDALTNPVSVPGMPCGCRGTVRVNQNLITAQLRSTLCHLDDLDTALKANTLPDWSGKAARSYRSQLTDLGRQSAALRDAIDTTSRILWSVGAA